MKRILLSVLYVFLLLLSSCAPISPSAAVTVDFLDVGKADCIVISGPEGVVMIDTGEEENLPEILAFLDSKKIDKIDTLILSHFDKDHIGGAAKIISDYNVSSVFQSSFSSDRQEFNEYHKVMEEKGITANRLSAEYSFSVGECQFTIHPPKLSSYPRKEDNNASLIVEMEYGKERLLFCGDAMEERLDEFLSEENGSYQIVKLPYHGNYLENYPPFLKSTSPETAILTCSKKNPADEETLFLLSQYEVKTYLTQQGSVHIDLNQDEYHVFQ